MEPPKGRGVGFFSAAFYGQAGRMRWWLFVCQGNPSREVRTERRAVASDNHAFPLLLFTGLLFVCECEIYICLQIRSAFQTLPRLFVCFFIHHPPPLLLLFLLFLCKLFMRCQKPVRMFWNISD